MPSIPPGLRALFEAAGPVIRYRLLRDVLGQDDSYIETAHLGLDLARHPEVEALVAAQRPDATWNGVFCIAPPSPGGGKRKSAEKAGAARETPAAPPLTTELAILRLCELGRESSSAVGQCVEKVLLPTLFEEHVLWEFARDTSDPAYPRAARHIVRTKALRLICRATREFDPVIKPYLEAVLAEWDLYLATIGRGEVSVAPPTADAWAAVCWYPWADDELERVHGLARRLIDDAEARLAAAPAETALFAPYVFALHDKWEYAARPPLLLYDLEHAARLGLVRDTAATAWLLEELEAHQDADGTFRFDVDDLAADWYFPLEARSPEAFPLEGSFRAALIFKLLEYDL